MDAGIAESGQQAERLHRARHEERLLHVLGEIQRLALQRGVEKILGVQDAAEVIETLAAHGEDVLCMLPDQLQVVAQGIVEVEPEHLRARRHEGGDDLVGEVENAIHHGLLALGERAILCPLLHEFLDVILGNGVLIFLLHAQLRQERLDGLMCELAQGM